MPRPVGKAAPDRWLVGGAVLLVAAGVVVILARLKPKIGRFLAEMTAEAAIHQASGPFVPTGAIPVIVSSDGRLPE